MKTYFELFEKLKTLSTNQLNSNIILMSDNQIIDKEIDVVISNDSLYQFYDTDLNSYCDFETDENAEEYDSVKLLDNQYPIIIL